VGLFFSGQETKAVSKEHVKQGSSKKSNVSKIFKTNQTSQTLRNLHIPHRTLSHLTSRTTRSQAQQHRKRMKRASPLQAVLCQNNQAKCWSTSSSSPQIASWIQREFDDHLDPEL
jgi:hypothetical protein